MVLYLILYITHICDCIFYQFYFHLFVRLDKFTLIFNNIYENRENIKIKGEKMPTRQRTDYCKWTLQNMKPVLW